MRRHVVAFLVLAVAVATVFANAAARADAWAKRSHRCASVRSCWRALDWARSERRRLESKLRVTFRADTVGAIRLAARAYDLNAARTQSMFCIANAESTMRWWAYNPSGASGLFQWMPRTWSSGPFAAFSVLNPYANALAAARQIATGGYGPWRGDPCVG